MILQRHLSSRMSKRIPVILVLLLLCIPGVAAAPALCDVQESSNILIIHSYGPDMDWVVAVT